MNKLITIASLAFAMLCASAAFANHQWGNYHWERSTNPLDKALGDNVTSQWYDSLLLSQQDWDASSVLSVSIGSGGVKNAKRCSVKNGSIEICNERYGYNGWLGVATITISGDHITSGSVKLNDSYFDTQTYDTPAWRNSVMCQEIGHIWGLGHNDEDFATTTGTCMDYSTDPELNQHPDAHDYEMLEQIYSHLDAPQVDGGSGGCNPRSPKCNANGNPRVVAEEVLELIDMSGPAQWGRLVSEHGPQEVFELDFGGGNKIITFVTWTLETAAGPHDTH